MEPELAAALAAINARLEAIEIKVSGITHELRRDLRMVKASINDMAFWLSHRYPTFSDMRLKELSEVEALHEELDKIANAQIDIRARLALLEGKQP